MKPEYPEHKEKKPGIVSKVISKGKEMVQKFKPKNKVVQISNRLIDAARGEKLLFRGIKTITLHLAGKVVKGEISEKQAFENLKKDWEVWQTYFRQIAKTLRHQGESPYLIKALNEVVWEAFQQKLRTDDKSVFERYKELEKQIETEETEELTEEDLFIIEKIDKTFANFLDDLTAEAENAAETPSPTETPLKELDYNQLRAKAKTLGVSGKGKKEDIISRIKVREGFAPPKEKKNAVEKAVEDNKKTPPKFIPLPKKRKNASEKVPAPAFADSKAEKPKNKREKKATKNKE